MQQTANRAGLRYRLTGAAVAVLLSFAALAGMPASAVADDAAAPGASGTWGDCAWSFEGDTLVVSATDAGNVVGDSETAPWCYKQGNDLSGMTRVVLGTADAPVKAPDRAEYLLSAMSAPAMSAVKSIDIAHLDASSSSALSFFFSECESVSQITLPAGFGNGALWANSLFTGCTALERVTSEDCKFPRAEDVSGMFANCESLDSLSLPAGFAPAATKLFGLFEGCLVLSHVDLTKFVPAPGADMRGMFTKCRSLESVEMPEGFTAQASKLSRMFLECNSLTEIPATFALPEGVTAKNVFGFYESTRPDEILVTTYRGDDAGVIQYPWAADARALDISQIMGGLREVVLRDGAELAAGAQVGVGDSLKAAARPEAASHLHLDDVSAQWQRRAAVEGAFVDIEGAQGWAYEPAEADLGCELRVVALGSGNCTGAVASDPVKVAAAPAPVEPAAPAEPAGPAPAEPAGPAKSLAATGDASGPAAAALALCGLAALAAGAGASRARRR